MLTLALQDSVHTDLLRFSAYCPLGGPETRVSNIESRVLSAPLPVALLPVPALLECECFPF